MELKEEVMELERPYEQGIFNRSIVVRMRNVYDQLLKSIACQYASGSGLAEPVFKVNIFRQECSVPPGVRAMN